MVSAGFNWYGVAADAVLVLHFAFVAFVVVGLVYIWVGHFLGLPSVRNLLFRVSHIACMGLVVAEAAFHIPCPSTTWESALRKLAGEGHYKGSFLQYWIHKVMFFELGPKAFLVIYICFFLAILLSWIFVLPALPRWLRSRASKAESPSARP